MLVERFGAITAYWMVAGGFTADRRSSPRWSSRVKEQEEEVAESRPRRSDTAEVATDAAAQAAVQLPIALLGAVFSTPFGPSTARGRSEAARRATFRWWCCWR